MNLDRITLNSPRYMAFVAVALALAACRRSESPATDRPGARPAEAAPAPSLSKDNPIPQGARAFLGDVRFDRIDALHLSPDRKCIAVVGQTVVADRASKSVGVVDPTVLSPTTAPVTRVFDCQSRLQGAELDEVERIAWSPDSTSIAAVAHRNLGNLGAGTSRKAPTDPVLKRDTYDVRLFDLKTHDWKWIVGRSSDPILAVGFAGNDQVLAVYHVGRRNRELGEEAEVKLGATTSELLYTKPYIEFRFYRTSSGELIRTVKGPEMTHPAAVVGPQAASVALWEQLAKPATVMVFDPESGAKRFDLIGHRFGVGFGGVTFSGRGRYLATAALGNANIPVGKRTAENEAKILLWDAKTGKELHVIARESGPVDFNQGESRIVTTRVYLEGSEPKYDVSVWNVEPVSLVRRIEVPDQLKEAVFWSDDRILTVGATFHGGLNDRILVWNLSSADGSPVSGD